MPDLNLSTSNDGVVEEVTSTTDSSLDVIIRVPFDHQLHLDHFQQALDQGTVFADMRSRTGRLGIDISTQGEKNEAFTIDQNSIVYSARISPYMTDFLPADGHWQKVVGYPGWNPGKLIALMPQNKVNADKIREHITEREVWLREGSVVTDDGVQLTLNHELMRPFPYKMNVDELWQMHSDLPRADLALFQYLEQIDGPIIIPKNQGIVAHTNARLNGYSLIIRHDQDNGIRTTQAIHVSPHSGMDLAIGLKGSTTNDETIDHVIADFYADEKIALSPKFVVPELALDKLRRDAPRFSPLYRAHRHIPPTHGGQGLIGVMGDYDVKSSIDMKKFARDLSELDAKKHSLYFNTFPHIELIQSCLSPDYSDKVGAIIFHRPPMIGDSFNAAYYHKMKELADKGIEIIWDHPNNGRLFFHRIGFMADGDRVHYDNAYSSNSIFAVYGSASKCTDEDRENLHEALRCLAMITAQQAFVLNGGGPKLMEAASKSAEEFGLRIGTISLQIAQEQQQAAYRHLIMPFHGREINIRQQLMMEDAVGGYIVMPGGMGTYFETFEALTKNQIERKGRPTFIIGDHPIQHSVSALINAGIDDGRIHPDILKTIKFLKSGKDLGDAYMDHYHLDRQGYQTSI